MDTPGNQTVVFVSLTEGGSDRNGPIEVQTETPIPGCVFRPLRISEKQGLTEIATDVWQCIAPPLPAAINLAADGQLKYDGDTYQATGGAQKEYDLFGELEHVTVLCQRQEA